MNLITINYSEIEKRQFVSEQIPKDYYTERAKEVFKTKFPTKEQRDRIKSVEFGLRFGLYKSKVDVNDFK